MKTYDIKNKAKETTNTTIKTVKNMANFVMALALVTVALYAAWAVKTETNVTVMTYLLGAAAALIVVKGMFEVIRSFNR